MWVEIMMNERTLKILESHSLRGVWVEIMMNERTLKILEVTPFGECGLKW